MLKLPKGLKKKKKGKKSKKDQELFTEAELEEYRRQHQKQEAAAADENQQQQQHSADEREDGASGGPSTYTFAQCQPAAAPAKAATAAAAAPAEDADEWRRFNALATGVDSILKKTQGDLDRIKETSFFKRVPPPSEVQKREDAIRAQQEAEQRAREEQERLQREEEEKANRLTNAVIELSESEEESAHDGDDIFDTTYIDHVKELPLAYVPESPDKEEEGPDPFDTSYADSVITKVSKRGKQLVNIGAAVEVLTGRVESNIGRKPSARRPRRGPKDLLLVQSFDDDNVEDFLEKLEDNGAAAAKTLLDSPADLPDAPIDLTTSLHLSLVKHTNEEEGENEQEAHEREAKDEEDEAALLAFFGVQSSKPAASSAAAPAGPAKKSGLEEIIGEGEYDLEADDGVDPFDTQFVAKLLPASLNEDPDFDPRADNDDLTPTKEQDRPFSPDFPREKFVVRSDLLEEETEDSNAVRSVLKPSEKEAQKEAEDIDPFDTSAVNNIVAPRGQELKYLEKELLEKHVPPPRPPPLPRAIINKLKPSLSDDDFDPRAGDSEVPQIISQEERKASLSLQFQSPQHKVTFAVPSPDLLAVANEGGKIQKPLTPYYEKGSGFAGEEQPEDPFDTSFVGTVAPSQVELNCLAKDLLRSSAADTSKLSDDDDFDPRAVTPQPPAQPASDWLSAGEAHNTKVLTPAVEAKGVEEISYLSDPFDTSTFEASLRPGQAELKLIESELLPAEAKGPEEETLDFLSADDSLPVKALTPVIQGSLDIAEPEDIDPFDTSFASNIGPGQAEIKLLESELIEN